MDQGATEASPIACGHRVAIRREVVEEIGVYLAVGQLGTLPATPVHQYSYSQEARRQVEQHESKVYTHTIVPTTYKHAHAWTFLDF